MPIFCLFLHIFNMMHFTLSYSPSIYSWQFRFQTSVSKNCVLDSDHILISLLYNVFFLFLFFCRKYGW